MKIAIVGGGVYGLSTAWELARRGHDIEVFESETIPAERAAGTDISKAIRLEYGSLCERYAPLVERALERWSDAEKLTGDKVLFQPGVLCMTRNFSAGDLVFDSHQYLQGRGHKLEVLDPQEGAKRWPGFAWDKLQAATLNPLGGWLAASSAVLCLAKCASQAGAKIQENCPVTSVEQGWVGFADGSRREFEQVVVACGVWLSQLVPSLQSTARVSRQRMSFYRPQRGSFEVPVWLVSPEGCSGWYGFPMNDDGIVKIALHNRAETVDADADRTIDQAFLEESRTFANEMLPGLPAQLMPEGKCCFYTNSPSGDLIIERLDERTLVAGMGSGHAFKFGPVLGELVAQALETDDRSFSLAAQSDNETW